jgi:hypothetical protein
MSLHDHLHDQLSHDTKRPYSIDLTLELERQLEDESLPSTPAGKLDPQVLASIVMSVTEERDKLLKLLSEADTREAQLRDSLQLRTEKCIKLEDELEEARTKMKDDEDAITMLRTKVEESRRGLMRLQTENRRVSQGPTTLDVSRTGPSSKRASFTPLTGSGTARPNAHRRISSVSDSGLMFSDHGLINTSPAAPSFIVPDTASLSSGHPPLSSRRFSGLFSRGVPSELEMSPDYLSVELASVRRELETAKAELEEMGHELGESNDARQASETCVEALREFIAQHNVGVRPEGEPTDTPLPPPARPARNAGEETAKPGAGWGFKLWKVDTLMPSSSSPAPPPAEPLSKKIGGFFSSRASVSSTTPSNSSHRQPLSSSYSQEPMYNASDTSSISLAEPISPVYEGTGTDVDVINSQSSSPDMMLTPREKVHA